MVEPELVLAMDDQDEQDEEQFLQDEKANLISSGMEEIDSKMGGGLPAGSLTLTNGTALLASHSGRGGDGWEA